MGDFAMKKVRQMTRREFISTATAAAGAAFLPAAGDSAGVQDATTPAGRPDQIAWRARPFPLRQVRLGEGPFRQAMEANQKYLHFLPADRLLHNFRVTAGRPSSAEPVGGWEKPDGELRGHFAGGHILTAFALAYASTGDETLKTKGNYMVAELAKVQEALGGKYLGAYLYLSQDYGRASRHVPALRERAGARGGGEHGPLGGGMDETAQRGPHAARPGS
jgi:hypothetical protein